MAHALRTETPADERELVPIRKSVLDFEEWARGLKARTDAVLQERPGLRLVSDGHVDSPATGRAA